ncbi:MAG: hypothetical protein JNK02_10575 [Planctomycetes bacterium]|nr:hypothetical protein [Planctomycetota bacterium]
MQRALVALAFLCATPATAQVRLVWAQSHDGAGLNQQDLAYAVATDGARVIVAGRSYNTTSGFPPPPPSSDLEVVGYAADGSVAWVRRHDGPLSGDDVGYEARIDALGRVYVAGQSAGYSGSSYVSQRALLAFDAAGAPLWSRHDGDPAGPNTARALEVAANGDLIVGGTDGANGGDLSIQRFDASGALLWSWSADGGTGGYDFLYAVAIGPGGDVWGAGYVETGTRGKDFALVRLDGATGAEAWLRVLDGGANLDDSAFRVAVGADGSAVAAGYATRPPNGQDAFLARWDAAGALQWTRAYDGSAHQNDAVRGLAFDPFGRAVAAGTLVGAGTGQDFAVWVLEPSGALAWSATWNGPFGGDDFARGLVLDDLGGVILAGSSPGAGGAGDLDLTLAAWDARGVLHWTQRDAGTGSGNQRALAVAASGAWIAAAGYADTGAPSDYRTVLVERAATPFCFGDGSGTACPCGNASPPLDQAGCLHSLGSGARLAAAGTPSLATDTLVLQGGGMPNSSALYFQGTSQLGAGAGAAFGDGLRCAGGTILRLSTRSNAAGASSFPGPGDPSVSVRGLVAAPGSRTYQVWYRNAAAFCTSATFNLTNGLLVAWSA